MISSTVKKTIPTNLLYAYIVQCVLYWCNWSFG